jgi:2-oxoglutarate ferredoxin oxidoreductase subunit beta
MTTEITEEIKYTKKDFISDQEVKWCPGCGDYAILSSVQMTMTKIGRKKEDIVFISGIGCSSRFPYYMNTYGLHTIHGRAPAFASGLKTSNPDLSVWLVTGDGDGLSIGGNHLIHAIRRNFDMNILLFNNEIYGLTKGQYSPTSKTGLVTKSTPFGSVDRSFSPAKLVLGAGSSFIARTIDTDPKHMGQTFLAAEGHKGTSFVEIFQNCVIFNDKVHEEYTRRGQREENSIRLEHGKPMLFGKDNHKGIILKGTQLKVVNLEEDGLTESDILVHDQHDYNLAQMLSSISYPEFPMPIGILFQEDAPVYEDQFNQQISDQRSTKGDGDMNKLLHSGDTWTVE